MYQSHRRQRADARRNIWERFRERYEDEVLEERARKTFAKASTVFHLVELVLAPKRLRDLTESRIAGYKKTLRNGTTK